MKGVFCPLSDVFVYLYTCTEDQIFIRVLVINYNPEVGIDYYILYYCVIIMIIYKIFDFVLCTGIIFSIVFF